MEIVTKVVTLPLVDVAAYFYDHSPVPSFLFFYPPSLNGRTEVSKDLETYVLRWIEQEYGCKMQFSNLELLYGNSVKGTLTPVEG